MTRRNVVDMMLEKDLWPAVSGSGSVGNDTKSGSLSGIGRFLYGKYCVGRIVERMLIGKN